MLHTDNSSVLVIRVWVEPGTPAQLRARVTGTNDVNPREDATTAAGSVQEIEEKVHRWLGAFVARTLVRDTVCENSLT